ncbi:Hypothetical protein CINCED_3A012103 [Cinara cedri]|uniref:Uncharacterized protein n=1 Tax=Cinara cedri TaxID=506608 RepID=A0A5E4M1W1_9HEMI|nr:Hypothetical protein CINCED_3A012103 [Cinara cedri]
MDQDKKGMLSQPHFSSNLMISKDIPVTPINDEENNIMSLLKKLPHITVFKVPESPKPKSNVFFEKNILANRRENNIVNVNTCFNSNVQNLKRNSNIKQTLKRKQKQLNDNITLTNNVNKIISKNLNTTPEKYPKKNNQKTSSPNVKKIKKSEPVSKIEFTDIQLAKAETESNKEVKANKLAVSEDFIFLDLSTVGQNNLVSSSPTLSKLDPTNVTDTEYTSFVMGIDHSQHSITHLKTDQNNKVNDVVENTIVTENETFCNDSKQNNEVENSFVINNI